MTDSPLYPGDVYLTLPRAPETWLIENLLPVGGNLLLYGDPKVGKSFAALQMACAIASGQDWLGFPVGSPSPVVYVQLDTPRSLWADRVQSLAHAGHPVERVHFADRETLHTHPFDIMDDAHYGLLRDSLVALKPSAVIIDTLKESNKLDENDATAMQQVVARLESCVKPAALILVTHARKSNEQQGYSLINDSRGSNYVISRMDGIVRFSHKSMRCVSRSIEEQTIKLERLDNGTWELDEDPLVPVAEMVITSHPGASIREMARIMAERSDRSASACRAVLRRLLAKRAASPKRAAQASPTPPAA